MKPLLLIGCGGHARSLIELVESAGIWKIQGLVGLPEQVGTCVLNHPVIGCDADLGDLRKRFHAALLAIGQLPDPTPRKRLASQLDKL